MRSFFISLYFEGRLSFIIVYQLIIADLRKDCCSRGVTSTITKLLTWSQERFVVFRHFCKFFSNTFEIQRTLKKINDKRLGMKTLHVYKMFCVKKSQLFWKLKLRGSNRLYALLWRLRTELENLTLAAGDRAPTSDKFLLSAKKSVVTRWTDKISLRWKWWAQEKTGAYPFSLSPTTSKGLLRRIKDKIRNEKKN